MRKLFIPFKISPVESSLLISAEDFWIKIKALLRQKHSSFVELSNASGISADALRHLSSRNAYPSVPVLSCFLDYFGMSFEELMYQERPNSFL